MQFVILFVVFCLFHTVLNCIVYLHNCIESMTERMQIVVMYHHKQAHSKALIII